MIEMGCICLKYPNPRYTKVRRPVEGWGWGLGILRWELFGAYASKRKVSVYSAASCKP